MNSATTLNAVAIVHPGFAWVAAVVLVAVLSLVKTLADRLLCISITQMESVAYDWGPVG